MQAANIDDYQAIREVIQHYIDGARAGVGELMRPGFHQDATIYGYVCLPDPSRAYTTDENGPAPDIKSVIASIDIYGTVATVRLESDNWTGLRFTDLFNLLKTEGRWQIMNKVFHLHQ